MVIEMTDTSSKKMDCLALPKGWKREEMGRKSGLSSGKTEVCYYSPSGKKFRTKPELARYLGDAIDLSSFDFKTGKINAILLRKSRKRGGQFDYRNDGCLIAPIRQTASIFKQPVTVVKTQPDSKVKADFKHGNQDKPKQLFWEKRLQGLRACNAKNEEEFNDLELPKNLKAVGPHVTDTTIVQSIATALHVSSQPITGQTTSRSNLDKNPGVFVNPDQPLVQVLDVTEDDIRKQEEKVQMARKKLEVAVSTLDHYVVVEEKSDQKMETETD